MLCYKTDWFIENLLGRNDKIVTKTKVTKKELNWYLIWFSIDKCVIGFEVTETKDLGKTTFIIEKKKWVGKSLSSLKAE